MPRGGARPNSGPKPKAITDWRKRMEQVFKDAVTEDDVKHAALRWVAKLKAGQPEAAFMWDRLLGKVTDKTETSVAGVIKVEVEYVNTPAPPGAAPGAAADQGGA